jgi:hypothetical protein
MLPPPPLALKHSAYIRTCLRKRISSKRADSMIHRFSFDTRQRFVPWRSFFCDPRFMDQMFSDDGVFIADVDCYRLTANQRPGSYFISAPAKPQWYISRKPNLANNQD